jgi:hypothetical protein
MGFAEEGEALTGKEIKGGLEENGTGGRNQRERKKGERVSSIKEPEGLAS